MEQVVSDTAADVGIAGAGSIRRRRIIYVSGYDPRGAQGYFEMFRRTCDRAQRLWPVSLVLQPPEIESKDFAHWRVDARGPDWQAATHYDFLRMEGHIGGDVARSTASQLLRALVWLLDDTVSGTQLRIFRASWRFGLHLLCFHFLLLAWIGVPTAVAVLVGLALVHHLGWPIWAAVVSSLVTAGVVVLALRPLADRWRLIQICNSWSLQRRFARGRPTWLDTAIDAAARRLVATAAANDVDELAVVGHSSGCVIALAIMARAMELDPGLFRRGPRLVLLTLGSVMPATALHPDAQRMRDIVGRLAAARGLEWVDCQSRKDVMCFANFDPVDGIGVNVDGKRRNPLLWRINFRDVIAPQNYNRFRMNFFRVHYQYIRGGDRRAPYDYALLIAGPVAIPEWPTRAADLVVAFAAGTSVNRC